MPQTCLCSIFWVLTLTHSASVPWSVLSMEPSWWWWWWGIFIAHCRRYCTFLVSVSLQVVADLLLETYRGEAEGWREFVTSWGCYCMWKLKAVTWCCLSSAEIEAAAQWYLKQLLYLWRAHTDFFSKYLSAVLSLTPFYPSERVKEASIVGGLLLFSFIFAAKYVSGKRLHI